MGAAPRAGPGEGDRARGMGLACASGPGVDERAGGEGPGWKGRPNRGGAQRGSAPNPGAESRSSGARIPPSPGDGSRAVRAGECYPQTMGWGLPRILLVGLLLSATGSAADFPSADDTTLLRFRLKRLLRDAALDSVGSAHRLEQEHWHPIYRRACATADGLSRTQAWTPEQFDAWIVRVSGGVDNRLSGSDWQREIEALCTGPARPPACNGARQNYEELRKRGPWQPGPRTRPALESYDCTGSGEFACYCLEQCGAALFMSAINEEAVRPYKRPFESAALGFQSLVGESHFSPVLKEALLADLRERPVYMYCNVDAEGPGRNMGFQPFRHRIEATPDWQRPDGTLDGAASETVEVGILHELGHLLHFNVTEEDETCRRFAMLPEANTVCSAAAGVRANATEVDRTLLGDYFGCIDRAIHREYMALYHSGASPILPSNEVLAGKRREYFADFVLKAGLRQKLAHGSAATDTLVVYRQAAGFICAGQTELEMSAPARSELFRTDAHGDTRFRLPLVLEGLVPMEPLYRYDLGTEDCSRILFR